MLQEAGNLTELMKLAAIVDAPVAHVHIYTELCKGYVRSGDVVGAERIVLHDMAARGLTPTASNFAVLIRAYAFEGRPDEANRIVSRMLSYKIEPDNRCVSMLVKSHAVAGDLDAACKLIQNAPLLYGTEVTPRAYEAVYMAYAAAADYPRALHWIKVMYHTTTRLRYGPIVRIAAAMPLEALEALVDLLSNEFGLCPPLGVWMLLLVKYHDARHGEDAYNLAHHILDMRLSLNLKNYKAIMNVLAFVGDVSAVYNALTMLVDDGLSPDKCILAIVLKAHNNAQSDSGLARQTWQRARAAGVEPDERCYYLMFRILAWNKSTTESHAIGLFTACLKRNMFNQHVAKSALWCAATHRFRRLANLVDRAYTADFGAHTPATLKPLMRLA